MNVSDVLDFKIRESMGFSEISYVFNLTKTSYEYILHNNLKSICFEYSIWEKYREVVERKYIF